MNHKLQTTRLSLRPCGKEDVEALYALWTSETIRRFLFDDCLISPEQASAFVTDSLTHFFTHGYGLWVVSERTQGQLVGFAGLVPTADGIPNLLYGIGADDCGRGYATEAAQAVIRYAFDVLKLLRVRADVDAPNTASVSVLRKLGMVCVAQTVVKEKPLLTYELSATAGVV